jgi:ribosomal protein S18 acetylase RimI-like enzyme
LNRTLVTPTIRPLAESDRPQVEAMTRACAMFRPEEVTVALEVFDAAVGIGRRRDPDYETGGIECDGMLAGWACWGPTPCTVGTFDLYWIVVAAGWQGQGVGSALLAEIERQVTGRARLIVVETAGREQYRGTRGFYESRGYHIAARIADYYESGDDLVTYVKRVQGSRESGDSGNTDSQIS